MKKPRLQQRGERRIAAALRIALAAALLAVQVLFVVLTTRYLKDHFALIYGAYFALRSVFDFSAVTALLGKNAGVTAENFLWVSLYISFVNSLLEEFFFRGFAFLVLRRYAGERFACVFSALSFALYHTAMMLGWFPPLLFLLALAGLTAGGVLFNLLDARAGTIFPSWAVHIFANLAINTVGFILFKFL